MKITGFLVGALLLGLILGVFLQGARTKVECPDPVHVQVVTDALSVLPQSDKDWLNDCGYHANQPVIINSAKP